MRLLMLGTGDFAVPTFLALCQSPHHVVGLVTQPDRPQGRKLELIPSRIKQDALARSIHVFQPENVNTPDSLETIGEFYADLLVTAAYGQILSAELLSLTPHGGINLHGSILPAYRGAAPVARAVQNGETETGVTVIHMTPRLDAGAMLAIARTSIGPDETAGELEDRLATLGVPLVLETIQAIEAGSAKAIPQDRSLVTKAPKLKKEESQINWSRPAQDIHNLVRAMNPWPLASTSWLPSTQDKLPLRLIIHKTRLLNESLSTVGVENPGQVVEAKGDRLIVNTGQGHLALVSLQVPGKKLMPVSEFLRGNRIVPGDLLGVVEAGDQ